MDESPDSESIDELFGGNPMDNLFDNKDWDGLFDEKPMEPVAEQPMEPVVQQPMDQPINQTALEDFFTNNALNNFFSMDPTNESSGNSSGESSSNPATSDATKRNAPEEQHPDEPVAKKWRTKQPASGIAKPQNSFLIFKNHHQDEIKRKNPGITFPQIGKSSGFVTILLLTTLTFRLYRLRCFQDVAGSRKGWAETLAGQGSGDEGRACNRAP